MKFQPSALKEETNGPILDCDMNLALSKTAGLGTGRVSDEGIIRASGRVFRKTEVVVDEFLEIQVTFCILNLSKFEDLGRTKGGRVDVRS